MESLPIEISLFDDIISFVTSQKKSLLSFHNVQALPRLLKSESSKSLLKTLDYIYGLIQTHPDLHGHIQHFQDQNSQLSKLCSKQQVNEIFYPKLQDSLTKIIEPKHKAIDQILQNTFYKHRSSQQTIRDAKKDIQKIKVVRTDQMEQNQVAIQSQLQLFLSHSFTLIQVIHINIASSALVIMSHLSLSPTVYDLIHFYSKEIDSVCNEQQKVIKSIRIDQSQYDFAMNEVLSSSSSNVSSLSDIAIQQAQENTEHLQYFAKVAQDIQMSAQSEHFTQLHNQVPRLAKLVKTSEKPLTLHSTVLRMQMSEYLDKEIYTDMSVIVAAHQFEDNEDSFQGDYKTAIIRAQNGRIFIGNLHGQISVFDNNLVLSTTIKLSDKFYLGIAIGNLLFFGLIATKMVVYNADNLDLIKTIKTTNIVTKILQIDEDHLLLGDANGQIQLIQISTLSIIFKGQFKQKEIIYDAIKTPNANEYAFALDNGIIFGVLQLDKVSSQYSFVQKEDEAYFEDKQVQCIASVNANYLIACVLEMDKLQVIDRSLKQVIKYIDTNTPNGRYNSLQKVIGYDDTNFPYLLLKDHYHITLIDTLTMETHEIIQCECCISPLWHTMIQFKEGSQLKLLTLFYITDGNKKIVKEYTIGKINH